MSYLLDVMTMSHVQTCLTVSIILDCMHMYREAIHCRTLTAWRHITVLPSSVTVGGKAPRFLPPLPGVSTEVVSSFQFRVVSKVKQMLVGEGGVP